MLLLILCVQLAKAYVHDTKTTSEKETNVQINSTHRRTHININSYRFRSLIHRIKIADKDNTTENKEEEKKR